MNLGGCIGVTVKRVAIRDTVGRQGLEYRLNIAFQNECSDSLIKLLPAIDFVSNIKTLY